MAIVVDRDTAYLPEYGLKVFRLKGGCSAHVRLIGVSYGGLIQHYSQKTKGIYCRGDECPPADHRIPWQYRGYTAAEYYNQLRKQWIPVVLEMTELLELTMRPIFRRGQIWLLTKGPDVARRRGKLSGQLLENVAENTLREPFDILPPLRSMYRVLDLVLDKLNPIPLPAYLEPSGDPAPGSLTRDGNGTTIDPGTFKRLMAERMPGHATGNGKAVH